MAAKFFIVGTGRSGTDLLTRILNLHPDVLVFNESFFLLPGLCRYGVRKINANELLNFALSVFHHDGQSTLQKALHFAGLNLQNQENLFNKIKNLNIDINIFELLEIIASFSMDIIGKSLWGEKTPDAGYYAKEIGDYWKNTLFINIYRDGYNTALSMKNHDGFKANIYYNNDEWVPLSLFPNNFFSQKEGIENQIKFEIFDFLELWGRRFLFIEEQLNKLSEKQVLNISFENLLSNSNEELIRLCSFLHLPVNQKWLNESFSLIDPSKKGNLFIDDILTKEPFNKAFSAIEASKHMKNLKNKNENFFERKNNHQLKNPEIGFIARKFRFPCSINQQKCRKQKFQS
ncbi:sulfotransferase family protein [Leptospirillum ferriphilum]|uniref:Sulfotransferase n=1 Tax=Leptospirillum ferriphilum YSK TaxID=1441628 RepID=A0A059XTD7_9BACT|nr:sulfotransferase [Leptospirillum ferriphilum]AIA31874.1 hypothetical protein Y981_09400 [Leptospirillum ferriphilum YSK]